MPRLEYDVVFTLDQTSVNRIGDSLDDIAGSRGFEKVEQDAKELNSTLLTTDKQLENLEQQYKRANKVASGFANANRQTTRSTQAMSKSVNNSNQILFSFGDAVQDGAQFQQGFASGARAIGNNLTFAAEQIALANQKTGSLGGTLKGLGSALIGPAGIVFAVNAAVTVLTVFGDELFNTEEKAKGAKEEIEGLTSRVNGLSEALAGRDFFGEDPFGIKELEFQQDTVDDLINQLKTAQTTVGLTREEQSELNKLVVEQTTPSQFLTQQEKNRLNILKARQEEATNFNGLIDQLKKDRQEITAELKTQEAIQKRVLELERQRQGQVDIGRAGLGGQVDIIGAGARQRAKERQQFFKDLGISEVELERSIANSKVQVHKNTEQAKTQITKQQSRARTALISQAASAAGNILSAAFGASKEVRIATALIDTYASAQSAYASQLIPGDPTSLARAQAAAALAVASGLARVAQIAAITPENASAGGGGGTGGVSEGFSTTSIDRGQRQVPNSRVANEANRRNQGDININLSTEADSRVISKKATQGRKELDSNVTAKVRSES